MITDCANCPFAGARKVEPVVVPNAAMTVLAESPGYTEEQTGRILSGKTGQFFDRMLSTCGIPRSKLNLGNAVMCKPPDNADDKAWVKAIKCCSSAREEFLAQSTNTLLVLGKQATKCTLGYPSIFAVAGAPFHNWRGSDVTVIPTLHPAFVMREDGRPYWPIVIYHLHRAWLFAIGALKPWAWGESVIDISDRAEELLTYVAETRCPISVDVETIGTDPRVVPMTAFGLGTPEFSVVLPWDQYQVRNGDFLQSIEASAQGKRCANLIREIMKNGAIDKIYQNGIYDITVCRSHNIEVNNYAYDLMAASATAFPGTAKDLGFVANIDMHCEAWKTIYKKVYGKDAYAGDAIALRKYCAKDNMATAYLKEPSLAHVKELVGGLNMFNRRMNNLRACLEMSYTGVATSQAAVNNHVTKIQSRVKYYRRSFYKIVAFLGCASKQQLSALSKKMEEARAVKDKELVANLKRKKDKLLTRGTPVSPMSNKDIVFLLEEKLGVDTLPKSEKTRASSVAANVLSALLQSRDELVCGIAKTVLGVRKHTKLIGIIRALSPNMTTGRIYPSWIPWCKTGRWSAKHPPVQTIPHKARDVFVPDEANWWIVEADYDCLEGALSAHIYGDEAFLKIFERSPSLVHNYTAMNMWPDEIKSLEACPKNRRQYAKQALYASFYGAEPETMYAAIVKNIPTITLREVGFMREEIRKIYKPIFDGQEALLKYVSMTERVPIPLSRYEIPLYGLYKDSPSSAKNKALNWPIQSSGAFLIDNAIARLSETLLPEDGRMILQVHDAIVLTGPDRVRLGSLLKDAMEQTITYLGRKLKYTVTLKIGRSWGALKEYKNVSDIET